MFIQKVLLSLLWICLLIGKIFAQGPPSCVPGWVGKELINGENLTNWAQPPEFTLPNSFGRMEPVTGPFGNAVQLNWTLGPDTTDYVQARYDFKPFEDLSSYDIFGVSLRGNTSPNNFVSLMFVDADLVFYGVNCDRGLSSIPLWMKNLVFPKKEFHYFFRQNTRSDSTLDWTKIKNFYVVVKRPKLDKHEGGSGQLAIDHLQAGRTADWQRQQQFESVRPNAAAADNAVSFILSQQEASGLFVAWKQDSVPNAYLYDQALALIVLTREGWKSVNPSQQAAQSAKRLVEALNLKQDPSDGHWPRHFDPQTGNVKGDNQWVGDQAWWIMALMQYFIKSGDSSVYYSAQRGAEWLEKKIDLDGKVIGPDKDHPKAVTSTEGTVDAWWAMVCTRRYDKADLIENYLLTAMWDADLKYWWRGDKDPGVALDCATWVAEFAKTPRVNQPERARQALSFVRRALITKSDHRPMCGFDGAGPVGVWSEGTAQYIVAGGKDAQQYLDSLLTLQDQMTGGMPGSIDEVIIDNCYVWLTRWTGISSTAWLYFALTGSPFPFEHAVSVAERNEAAPVGFVLEQNYPNPFTAAQNTVLRFDLPGSAAVNVELAIFNLNGQLVRQLFAGTRAPGRYEIKWNGKDEREVEVPSGIYWYRVQAGKWSSQKRLLVLR